MYTWKSCTLNGVEISSLRLNGKLVWEKLISDINIIYYGYTTNYKDAISITNTLPEGYIISKDKKIYLTGSDSDVPVLRGWYLLVPVGSEFVSITENDEPASLQLFDLNSKGLVTIGGVQYDYYANGKSISRFNNQNIKAEIK